MSRTSVGKLDYEHRFVQISKTYHAFTAMLII
jgi:hypothetical protein